MCRVTRRKKKGEKQETKKRKSKESGRTWLAVEGGAEQDDRKARQR